MADDTTSGAATTPDPGTSTDPPDTPAGTGNGSTDEPTDAEGWRKYVARINRESAQRRKENDALTARLKEHEDAQKTEQQKLAERAEVAERERDQLRVQMLRWRVAAELDLPADLADRLRGDTEDDMREDGKRLASLLRPAGSVGGGRGGSVPPPSADDMNARIRAAAGRGT